MFAEGETVTSVTVFRQFVAQVSGADFLSEILRKFLVQQGQRPGTASMTTECMPKSLVGF